MLPNNDGKNRLRFFTKDDEASSAIRRTMREYGNEDLACASFTAFTDVRADDLDLLLTGVDAVVLQQPRRLRTRAKKYVEARRLVVEAALARNLAIATIVVHPIFEVTVGAAGTIRNDYDLGFLLDALACGAGRGDEFVDALRRKEDPVDEDLFDETPPTPEQIALWATERDVLDPILPEYEMGDGA